MSEGAGRFVLAGGGGSDGGGTSDSDGVSAVAEAPASSDGGFVRRRRTRVSLWRRRKLRWLPMKELLACAAASAAAVRHF